VAEDSQTVNHPSRTCKKTRKIKNNIRKEIYDGNNGLTDKEESSSKLSLVAQITMLNKTVQILGQILKNQYSKIPREEKGELINELFRDLLRELRSYCTGLEKDTESESRAIAA